MYFDQDCNGGGTDSDDRWIFDYSGTTVNTSVAYDLDADGVYRDPVGRLPTVSKNTALVYNHSWSGSGDWGDLTEIGTEVFGATSSVTDRVTSGFEHNLTHISLLYLTGPA